MNKFLPFVLLLLSTLGLQAQIRFTSVNPATDEIIIKNFGSTEVDIQQYRLCALFEYANLSNPSVTLVSGSFLLAPGETVTITWAASNGFNTEASDLGLYMPMGSFALAANMVDFMQYGNSGQGREGVAVTAGLWTAGDFLTGTGPWEYTSADGTGDGVNFWAQLVIPGCTAIEACNYNSQATADDASCTFPGEPCDDANAATIDDILSTDCVCAGVTGGCTELTACNYSATAAFDDGSCYFSGDNCDDGDVFTNNDVYGADCVCAGEAVVSVEGCTAMEACNYNPDATIDNGNCIFPGEPCDDGNAATIDDVLGADCVCAGITGGCTEMVACNYDAAAAFDDGSCLFPGDNCDDENVFTTNDVYGADCVCAGEEVTGIEGCTAMEACNYNPDATIDNGNCTFPGEPCDDANAATIDDVLGADCVCAGITGGCTEMMACNYDAAAAFDDGSCLFPGDNCDDENVFTTNDVYGADCVCAGEEITGIEGCTAMEACNYNPDATIDNGNCIFPGEPCDDGNAATIDDVLGADCVCAGITGGCTEMMACNYDAAAAFDDGSCLFPGDNCDDENVFTTNDVYGADCVCAGEEVTGIEGCTAMEACNYNPDATIDNGNCTFPGEPCDDANAATIDDVLGADCVCAGITGGCTEMMACNYNAAAAFDDGSCSFPGDNCNDGNDLTNNDIYGADCTCAGTLILEGCTDTLACNYDALAVVDNGLCVFPGSACDDNNANTVNDSLALDCTCIGDLLGCNDVAACNYNALAGANDGSCIYPGTACDDGDVATINDALGADCICRGEYLSILEIVVASPDHNTLEAAVVAAGLQSAFAGAGQYTLFAPTDAAFAALPAGTLDNLLADPTGLLSDVLLYHAVNGVTFSNQLSNGMVITSIQGQDLMVTINAEGVFINNAKVIVADIPAANGVIHVIDAVLVPVLNPNPATVVDIIVNSADHTILESAVIAAGLVDELSGPGPFTVFAPTDAAFNALPAGLLNNLLADPTGALAQVLLYHVAAGQTYYNSLFNSQNITTLLNEEVTVTITGGSVFINNSRIILANLVAANGIVHVIDAVLTPVISVEETLLSNSTIYPNPAVNELYVSTPSINGGGSYSIYSMTGSLIEQGYLYSTTTRVNIDALSQGMYQLKLVYGNDCVTRSFIKQ